MRDGYSCQGILTKISTTVDGGWRLTFDIPSDQSNALLDLAKLRDTVVQLGIVPTPKDELGGLDG